MKENTLLTEDTEGILKDQQTVTGGVRTYGSYIRTLEEGVSLGNGAYRFEIAIPYENVTHVKGVLSVSVAEYRVNAVPFCIGRYIQKVFFEPRKAFVDVCLRTQNADVIAVNIEGRIVDSRNLPL